jgi:small membrane protein
MIIQLLLSSILLGVFAYALSQRQRSAPISLAIMTISLGGIILVLFPEVTTRVARTVGVGRGADLVFYCFILITLAAIFNIHLRLRASAETTTDLARAWALATARRPESTKAGLSGSALPLT